MNGLLESVIMWEKNFGAPQNLTAEEFRNRTGKYTSNAMFDLRRNKVIFWRGVLKGRQEVLYYPCFYARDVHGRVLTKEQFKVEPLNF